MKSSKSFDDIYREVFEHIYHRDFDETMKHLSLLQRQPHINKIVTIRNELINTLRMVSVSKAIWNYFGFETLSNEKLIKIQASIERQYRDYHLELNQTKIPSYLKNFVGEKYEIELLYDAFVILLSARMFSFLAILIWLVNNIPFDAKTLMPIIFPKFVSFLRKIRRLPVLKNIEKPSEINLKDKSQLFNVLFERLINHKSFADIKHIQMNVFRIYDEMFDLGFLSGPSLTRKASIERKQSVSFVRSNVSENESFRRIQSANETSQDEGNQNDQLQQEDCDRERKAGEEKEGEKGRKSKRRETNLRRSLRLKLKPPAFIHYKRLFEEGSINEQREYIKQMKKKEKKRKNSTEIIISDSVDNEI
ncbi:ST7 protein [Sarcoptes scabiei]|nr:ST7 protein [Sarcoptes scabiei]